MVSSEECSKTRVPPHAGQADDCICSLLPLRMESFFLLYPVSLLLLLFLGLLRKELYIYIYMGLCNSADLEFRSMGASARSIVI